MHASNRTSSGSVKDSGISQLVRNTSYSNFFTQIDNLTTETELDQTSSSGSLKEITRSHWIQFDNKSSCFNPLCRKPLSSLLERHHHCRRCGQIFCGTCVQFSRRLNKLAKPDPAGDWYKVCKSCFDQGQLTDGSIRSHTTAFFGLRIECQRRAAAREATLDTPSWRKKLDIDRECQRLLNGFENTVGSSEIKRTLHGMKSVVTTPQWMKSSTWIREDIATSCQTCHRVFNITRQKNFCRVCGIAVCKSCSSEDLLIYIPDEDKEKGGSCQPKLAIIRIIGCPEVQPEISWHIRVCSSCRNILEVRQVQTSEDRFTPSVNEEFLDQLVKVNEGFQNAESRIGTHLPQYREVIQSLEDSSKTNTNNSNMKILAKAQGDLGDALAQYITIVQQLKKLRPVTETQAVLLKTYIRAKCEFYLNQMSAFRTLKHKLCESVPPESLDFIQGIMDRNAIISTHLYLRQLVYETIHLCQKYKTDQFLPTFLTNIEQLVEKDVMLCLLRGKDNIEKHMSLVKEMIRERLKEKKLICLSQAHIEKKGSKYIQDAMQLRVETLLNQVNNQLCLISANRSFQASKAALQRSLDGLKNHKSETSTLDQSEWGFSK